MKKYHTVFLEKLFLTSIEKKENCFKLYSYCAISSKVFLKVQTCCGYTLSQTIVSQLNHALWIHRLHHRLQLSLCFTCIGQYLKLLYFLTFLNLQFGDDHWINSLQWWIKINDKSHEKEYDMFSSEHTIVQHWYKA